MTRLALLFLLVFYSLAACSAPPEDLPIPTLASLPTQTETTAASATIEAAPTATPEAATATPIPPASATPSPLPPTETPDLPTVTPSLTITDTPAPTATVTPSETPTESALSSLLALALQATVLPQPTLPPGAFAPTPLTQDNVSCAYAPSGAFGILYANEPGLAGQLGCPLGAPPGEVTMSSAAQSFERGAMIYLAGPPGYIYALSSDGRFIRYPDTFAEGSDPQTTSELPPAGLVAPIRGFLKVWSNNPDVRAALGWGVNEEAGATATVLTFDRGRMVYLPQRGETVVLLDDPGGASGAWRAFSTGVQ